MNVPKLLHFRLESLVSYSKWQQSLFLEESVQVDFDINLLGDGFVS